MKKDIDKGIRLLNFVIDITIIIVICIPLNLLLLSNNPNAIFLLVHFGYYFILESISGQTLGKMVTDTEVVNLDNTKPNVGKIFIRSILRLIPIDGYTYLFGQDQGGHDIMSRTRLRKVDNKI